MSTEYITLAERETLLAAIPFNFMTFLTDRTDWQLREPHGLAIVPDDETDGRQYRIIHWRADGLCDYAACGSYPTEEIALDVRGLIIEYIERYGYSFEAAATQARREYAESLA